MSAEPQVCVPAPDPDTRPFWDGLTEERLLICRCTDTARWIHQPLGGSRYTGGPVRFDEMSGAGTVLSFIVVRQALTQGRTLPYVTALIELDEQPCLRNNAIVDADPDTVRIGQRVTVPVVEPVASGFPIAEFVVDEPAAN